MGKVALEKKIIFYTDFLDREIIYLNVCLNDSHVLRMIGATNARPNNNNYAGGKEDFQTSIRRKEEAIKKGWETL